MYAGAPALIVSLWQVNDQATSVIMQSLYENLANGMTKDEALRQAKLSYLESAQDIAAHPAFWSPFIQIGNSSSITIKRKNTTWIWIAGIGGLILLIGGLLRLRRK